MNSDELKVKLGQKIKYSRNKINLSQEELAEKINRSQRQISLIELGKSFPSPETLISIAKEFKCSVKDLFDFEPIKEIENLKPEIYKLIDSMSDDKLKTIYIIGKNI